MRPRETAKRRPSANAEKRPQEKPALLSVCLRHQLGVLPFASILTLSPHREMASDSTGEELSPARLPPPHTNTSDTYYKFRVSPVLLTSWLDWL